MSRLTSFPSNRQTGGSCDGVPACGATVLRSCCLLLSLLACESPPIEWQSQHSATLPEHAYILTVDGSLRADTLSLHAIANPAEPVCPGSLRLVSSNQKLFAAWWAPRPDSGARLLAARSSDGGQHWTAPVAIDTTDASVSGCRREPPAIAADPRNGYVHVSYALLAAEGPGLFFAHSMDMGATFHAPVAILYGDRLGATSIAADGDIVLVAFEDPNSRTPRIGLAISHTTGHIFEDRVVPLSDDHGMATRPLVAVRGRRIAVAWEQHSGPGSPAALMVRTGMLR